MALSQGCASYAPAQHDSPLADQVDTGYQVRVIAADGAKRQFTVTGVDKHGLYDEEDYLRFDDMTEIEIRKRPTEESPSRVKTAFIVLGVILILDALGIGDAE